MRPLHSNKLLLGSVPDNGHAWKRSCCICWSYEDPSKYTIKMLKAPFIFHDEVTMGFWAWGLGFGAWGVLKCDPADSSLMRLNGSLVAVAAEPYQAGVVAGLGSALQGKSCHCHKQNTYFAQRTPGHTEPQTTGTVSIKSQRAARWVRCFKMISSGHQLISNIRGFPNTFVVQGILLAMEQLAANGKWAASR